MNRALAVFFVLLASLPLALGLSCGNSPSTPSSNPTPTSTPTVSYSLGVSFGSSGPITMDDPVGVANAGGNLWVTNDMNNSLQEWTTAGVAVTQITSFNAGETFSSPWGLAAGPDGYLYVGDEGHHRVVEFDPTGAYVTAFGSAELGSDFSLGVAVNSTYAFVTDETAKIVIRYTLAGTGSSKTFTSPVSFTASDTAVSPVTLQAAGIYLDNGGNPFVVGVGASAVDKFNASGVFQMEVTQGVAAPGGVAVDAAGNIFIAQTGPGIMPTPSVNQYDPSGNLRATYAAGLLSSPWSVAMDVAGNLYVCDRGHNQVVRFTRN